MAMANVTKYRILTHLRSAIYEKNRFARFLPTSNRVPVSGCQCYTSSLNRRRIREQQVQRPITRFYSSENNKTDNSELTSIQYEEIAEETLQSLSDKFDVLGETLDCDPEYDVSYGNGVLTVKISDKWGIYVINKQTPNKQIWLSSPVSGPKRYDYVDGTWIYSHTGEQLHQLLTEEISKALSSDIDFSECEYSNS